jgi:CRP-like cAMP-binding protein
VRYENYDVPDNMKPLMGLARRHHPRHHHTHAQIREASAELRPALFSQFTEAELRDIARAGSPFSYPANWAVVAQGSASDVCLLIVEGSARLLRAHETVAEIGAGGVIGMADALDGRFASASVVTNEPMHGIAVEAALLLRIVAHRPAHAAALHATVAVPAPRRVVDQASSAVPN